MNTYHSLRNIVQIGFLLALVLSIPAPISAAMPQPLSLDIDTFTPNNLSDIYSGDWRMKPAKISGRLYLPSGSGPFPAVILYHGSGHPRGLQEWFDDVVPGLVKAGLAAFVLDSYTQRRISSTARDQTRLSKATRLVDAFQALKALAARSDIDGSLIGITGYSFGGIIAMISADKRIVDSGLAGGFQFAAHLPVYPSCQAQFRTLDFTGAPMLFLVGDADDYTPARYCQSYVDRIRAKGYYARIKSYPGAYHRWIVDDGVDRCHHCVTFAGCGPMYIEDDGHETGLDGKASTRDGWKAYIQTLYKACGKRGVTLGMDRSARQDTLVTTVRFFSEALLSSSELPIPTPSQ